MIFYFTNKLDEFANKKYGQNSDKFVNIYEKVIEITPEDSDSAITLRLAYFLSYNFKKANQIRNKYMKKYKKDKIDSLENKTLENDVLFIISRESYDSKSNEILNNIKKEDLGLKIARSRLAHAYIRNNEFKKAKELSDEIFNEFIARQESELHSRIENIKYFFKTETSSLFFFLEIKLKYSYLYNVN